MKPVAAVVAILVLAALALAGLDPGGPGTAVAGEPVTTVRGLDGGGPLRLDLTDIAPRIVTADGPGALTVTGTLTNTGSTPVEELAVRVQRGEPLTTEGQIRDALDGNEGTDAVAPQFLPLAAGLAPGEQVPIRLVVALQGPPETTLELGRPGVYELLVNVNGKPRNGERARLAAVRLLLPVLSLPDPALPGEPRPATPFTLLYPITDTPRRLPTVLGEPSLLTDDVLATSFTPEGRLGELVAALAEQAPAGSPVRQATCVAIDPDLVDTALAMRGGYQVRGADGAPVPGAGAEAAGLWLDRLVEVARGGCVLALPYADADLVALTRNGMGTAATAAVLDGRVLLADVLQSPVLPGVTWPVDGVTDEPTLDAIGDADGRAVVLSAGAVERGRTQPGAGVLPIAGGRSPQFAVLTDPLLTLAATGADPSGPGTGAGGAAVTSSPTGTDTPMSTQDAIGALAFRAGTAETGGAPLVLAPPRRWAAEGTGARALLGAVGRLVTEGRLIPRGLDTVLDDGPAAGVPARPLEYPLTAGGLEIPAEVIGSISAASADLVDLRSAVVENPDADIEPQDVFGPLVRGLVRPASAAWRGQTAAAAVAGAAVLDRIAGIRATIHVLEPPSPYSLGTSEAPLPVTVANGLPLTVKVRIEVSSTSGLRVAPIAELQIPPLGRRQVTADVRVTRSGKFTVDAAVRTPDGGLLGPPGRLQVQSTAYGTITIWLTAGGGVLLVVLVARRILRRIRGEPAPPQPARQRVPSPIP